MGLDWRTWRVDYVTPEGEARRFWVRAISERDARYVATVACKRNDQRPRLDLGAEFTVTREPS